MLGSCLHQSQWSIERATAWLRLFCRALKSMPGLRIQPQKRAPLVTSVKLTSWSVRLWIREEHNTRLALLDQLLQRNFLARMRLQVAPKTFKGNCLSDSDLGARPVGGSRAASNSFFGRIDSFLDRIAALLRRRRRGRLGGWLALAKFDHVGGLELWGVGEGKPRDINSCAGGAIEKKVTDDGQVVGDDGVFGGFGVRQSHCCCDEGDGRWKGGRRV